MSEAPEIQRVEPVATQNPRLPTVEYKAPSEKTKLEPGQQLDLPPWPTEKGEWVIQRLTDRAYWMSSDAFCVTLFVGEEGAILVDAPQLLTVEELFGAIRRVTELPITTLVYSHPHVDHMGAADRIKDAVEEESGIELRVVASEAAVQEMERYEIPDPRPTEVLPNGRATFEFEGHQIVYATPVVWAHSGADSYVLTPDGVIHFVDFVYAQRLPMAKISGVQNVRGYVDFLRHVAGEEWDFANLGHDNVGHKKDVELTLAYFEDLYSTCFEIVRASWDASAFVGCQDHVGVFIRNVFDQTAAAIATQMADRWGHYPQYEIARDHAEEVLWDVFLNYDFLRHPEIRPSFTPIRPSEVVSERPSA